MLRTKGVPYSPKASPHPVSAMPQAKNAEARAAREKRMALNRARLLPKGATGSMMRNSLSYGVRGSIMRSSISSSHHSGR